MIYSRRLAAPILALLLCFASIGGAQHAPPAPSLEGLFAVAHDQRWDTLAIGESVARFGRALEGVPYVAGTLEGPGPEVCRVTTVGFDCVTFMEIALNLARTARTAGGREPTWRDVTRAITYTRYRGGRLDGYLSRLHYTSEWIADNIAKGVLEDVTPSLGGLQFPLNVGFMSAHPRRYPGLRDNPALADSMRRIERRINMTRRTHVPRDRVAGIERKLRTGDLVAITTSIAGLDYAHTGLIVREGSGARLLHASSESGRVLLDDRIGAYLARAASSSIGITVLRPRPPRGP
ncbi:MAG: N-acetylmuramoyl-L-alanine amidase-like domain-containing protein [Candidatus Eisenbacteria bacterium]